MHAIRSVGSRLPSVPFSLARCGAVRANPQSSPKPPVMVMMTARFPRSALPMDARMSAGTSPLVMGQKAICAGKVPIAIPTGATGARE